MVKLRAGVALGVVSFLVAACGPPAKSVQPIAADPTTARSATSLQRPPADRARVIVMSGETFRYTGRGSSYIAPHDMPGDIYVNDTKVGTLNHSEAMVFDLAPGAYSFSWIAFKESADTMKQRSEPSRHNLNGGGLLVLMTWYDSGLIVEKRFQLQRASLDARDHQRSSADAAGKHIEISPNIMIVRPSSCPPTMCL